MSDLKSLVRKRAESKSVSLEPDAEDALTSALEQFCDQVLDGAEKVRSYSKKERVDREAVRIAAFIDGEGKQLKI